MQLTSLRQLSLDYCNQVGPLQVHLILCLEERAALLVALGFEGLNLLLAGEFLFQRQCRCGSAAGFLDLAVNLLDLALETQLEVVGPTVEFLSFGLEEPGVALGNGALKAGLSMLDSGLDRAGGDP